MFDTAKAQIRNVVTERTRYGTGVLVLILLIPMLSLIAYGGVDIGFMVPLSVLTLVTLVLWAADGMKAGRLRLAPEKLLLPLLGLIVIGLIQVLPLGSSVMEGLPGVSVSSSISLDPYSTRFFLIRLVMYLAFLAAAFAYFNTRKILKNTALAIIIFGGVMAFLAIIMRLASPDMIYGIRPTPQAISFGPLVNQHHFAAFMELTAGMTLAMLFGHSGKNDRKALYGIAAALMFIAVMMTSSRGGFIGMICVTGAVLAANYLYGDGKERKGTSLKLILPAAGILFVTVASVLFLTGSDPIVRGIGMDTGMADVTNGRAHFWSIALQIFLDHPMIGAGLEAFGVAFTRYDTWNGLFRVEQAHNDYIQTLADSGLIGFACISAFIVLLFTRGLRVIRETVSSTRRSIAIGALAGCFGILVHSFFDFPLRIPSNAYFFLLLAVMATVQIVDDKKEHAGRRH